MPEIVVKLGDRIIHRYFFDKDTLSIGRARDNDIVIENLSVSRNHARIKKQDGKFLITDMNSANGTLLNGVRVTKAEINHDDQISIGKHTLHFVDTPEGGAAAGMPPAAGAPPISSAFVNVAVAAAAGTSQIGLLTVTKGKQAGQEFRVYKPDTTIGRAPESDIRLHDWFVSKKHGSILREGDAKFVLKDLDSWRGTTVNGNSVREVELNDGDEIVLGTTVLTFKRVDASVLSQPAVPVPAIIEAQQPLWSVEEEPPAPPPSRANVVLPSPAQLAQPSAAPTAAAPGATQDAIRLSLDSRDNLGSSPSFESGVGATATVSDEEWITYELEADHAAEGEDEEEHRQAMWEMTEAEKLFEAGGDADTFSLIPEDAVLLAEELAHVGPNTLSSISVRPLAAAEVAREDAEEQEALYGAPMTDVEPYGEPVDSARRQLESVEAVAVAPAPAAPRPAPPAPAPAAPAVPAPGVMDSGSAANLDPFAREVAMWEKALRNKSLIIRKNAAKELKKLTGKDYDWQSEPSSH